MNGKEIVSRRAVSDAATASKHAVNGVGIVRKHVETVVVSARRRVVLFALITANSARPNVRLVKPQQELAPKGVPSAGPIAVLIGVRSVAVIDSRLASSAGPQSLAEASGANAAR